MKRIKKYGRAFDWRLSRPPEETREPEMRALVDFSRSEQLEILEDYLYLSRKRHKSRLALAKVQLHLLEDLAVAQKTIKQFREHKERLGVSLPDAKGEERERIASDLEDVERGLFFQRHLANCIRLVGDGIAWRSLGYDRAALRLLSERSTKQEIMSDGLRAELAEWSRPLDTGQGLAIYNAVTNCLAFGDVTIVRDDGSVEVVEVKSSNTKSRRITRQKQGMNRVVELLKAGEGDGHEGARLSVLSVDLETENGLRDLLRLLEEASRRGFAAGPISNFLYAECVDFRSVKEFEKVRADLNAAREKYIKPWEERDDVFVPMDSADFLAFTPNCAPFSVFPFPEDICVGLMTGAVRFMSFLNQSEVAREFERRGWQVIVGPDDVRRRAQEAQMKGAEFNLDCLLKVKKNGFSMDVPPGDFTRLTMEMLRPEVLIKAREMIRALGPGATEGPVLLTFSREHEVWW
jgi:hypothetical protein